MGFFRSTPSQAVSQAAPIDLVNEFSDEVIIELIDCAIRCQLLLPLTIRAGRRPKVCTHYLPFSKELRADRSLLDALMETGQTPKFATFLSKACPRKRDQYRLIPLFAVYYRWLWSGEGPGHQRRQPGQPCKALPPQSKLIPLDSPRNNTLFEGNRIWQVMACVAV